MKRIMKTLALVAVAAMGLTACQNEYNDEQIVANDSVVVTFVADAADDTRTSVDTSDNNKPVFAWGENETFAVLEQTDALAEATSVTFTKEDGKAKIEAEFAANAGKGSYNYVTVYPESGYKTGAISINEATLSLPAAQTMAEGSYDPAADLMVSEVVNTTAQPSEAQMVGFTRLAAVAKMTLKNFSLEDGDAVESVTFTAEGEDKVLAGTFTADLANPAEFTVAEGVNNVTVATTSTGDVYFTVLPTTIAVGDSFTVTVVTNRYIYIKKVNIDEGKKPLEFQAGNVTLFGVNMQGVAPSDKWVLVKDASTLAEGDVVIIASNEYDMAMDYNVETGNTKLYHTATDVQKMGEYLINPSENVKKHTLYSRVDSNFIEKDTDGNVVEEWRRFDFYSEGHGFLYISTSGRSNLTTLPYFNHNTLFYITIDDATGNANIVAKDSEYSRQYMKYYSSSYFACADSKDDNICIYKLAYSNEEVATPIVSANVTVPKESVVVNMNAVAEATVFEDVVFNYVGDWTITASATVKNSDPAVEADWLTLNYADGKLSYTAEANEGEVRYATVAINATLNEQTNTIGTFEVVQKGSKPTKISIAEFKDMGADPNVVYEVTGKLTYLPKSTAYSSDAKLSDANENVANVRYIKNGDSWLVAQDVVQLGDVVTVTTVLTATGRGGSSSVNSNYVGHYRLTATPVASLVPYTGGKLTIDVATFSNGDIEVPETISGNMSQCEGVTFEYSGGDTATLTFTQNDTEEVRVVTPTFTYGEASVEIEITQDINPAMANGKWSLVTDASDLKEGDLVIIAAKDYDNALSTTLSNATTGYRRGTDITKEGNYLAEPSADVQQFVLVKGSVEGTFAFYDKANMAFIVSSSATKKYLINQPYYNDNSSFAISIENGETIIGNKAGEFATNILNYYDDSNYFYSSGAKDSPICLYKLVGGVGEIPAIDAFVEVPTKEVVIGRDAAIEATTIEDVEFLFVEGYDISVEDNADWLTVGYDKAQNCLTYTAEANTSEKRTATITITAKREGLVNNTWSFDILQKSAPLEISIAEFMKKEKDPNTTYKLTGEVTSFSSTSSGTLKITDGVNTATIKYLYDTNGTKVYGNSSIGLKVGDIATVYTIVTSTQGEGGNSTVANYSTYIGHYNITATAEPATVGYLGGTNATTITITINEKGNPDYEEGTNVVNGSLNDTTFATLNHTDNAKTATVNFVQNDGYPRSVDATFTYGLTSATVTVGQEAHPSVAWWLVTDVNDLKAGDKVIIVAAESDVAIGNTSSYSATTRPAKAITKGDGKIQSVGAEVQQYIIEEGTKAGTWSFKNTLGNYPNYYPYAASSSYNYLKEQKTKSDNSSWTIVIDNAGAATITAQGTYSRNILMYSGDDTFIGTTTEKAPDGAESVCIYKYEQKL